MVQETVRLLVRAIRVRKLVLELQDQVSKVARCHYTEDYLREVKILGNGELTKKLTVQANAFSASAKEKIEALGGKAEVI